MLIKNGHVFSGNEFVERDILIEGNEIKKISNRINESENQDEDIIKASGMIVMPGLIDLHVHLREPGFDYKEDFNTGTKAAVAGGISHVFDMPNNKVPVTTAKLLQEKIELAHGKGSCRISFYLGATSGNELEWKKLKKETQFAGLKIYMGQTTGNLIVSEQKPLETHFANFDPKRPIVVHAEDQKTIESKGRGEGAAMVAVENACTLAKKYSKKLHIAHASTGSEVALAKNIYPETTLETCPHYLFISERDIWKLGYKSGVNPPVKNNKIREELWQQLPHINCISTDHAPHTDEDKKNGAKGYPGLETSLALMLDAYNRKLIALETVPIMMSKNPARVVGLETDAGTIRVGATADITIADLKKEWVVKGEELETKCKWSPFEGRKLNGKNVITIIDGKIKYQDGELIA